MYYSIVHNSRYCVVLRDGVAEAFIMELPTEALADEVAFQLQIAWYDGESCGKDKMKKQLDPDGYHLEISNAIKHIKNKSQRERKQHHDDMEEQRRSQQKEVRQQVLHLKR
ncbi:hypothetical protein NS115_01110 [Paenibacillus jamilae]|uniref:Uncharacterized protein n=2 Tax=Paenibacillus jamilae TaxID=114136 RepID=A0ACC5A146_9BACL|nr:hypothetical protein [Paenibacillus sp. lzh-N1]AUO07080.1 hypothetical protein C0638_11280 [Paenibacillus sp. lzh-N1]KTS85109.1 hypothetical protein NS115_01110 [Paenibacillus jamilae]